MRFACVFLVLLLTSVPLRAADGNRLVYLDGGDPYYVSINFPKLVTQQWVGEKDVDAVVVLAIDDMRGYQKWEQYLRPILDRLKGVDGRAPVSIMTCQIDPREPHLQKWLAEGVTFDVHTIDHPCPLLKDGNFDKAKSTYDRCVDLLFEVPGNRPVAFRMPCCDSLNSPSPRFFAEIFNRRSPRGNFLVIDTSVFNITTSNDPALPRELVIDQDGQDTYRRYLPFPSFVNTIEDYPYPYVIGQSCWEFPCAVPSDWQAQNIQQPNNPRTVKDMQAAVDAAVIKQGVFNLVFHPHGWIRAAQIVQLIDHVVARHGKKVKFLNFREAHDRLNAHLLGGQSLRSADGGDNGVRLLDLNNDGYMDVVIGNDLVTQTRLWSPTTQTWQTSDFPTRLVTVDTDGKRRLAGARFGVLDSDGGVVLLLRTEATAGAWRFRGSKWVADDRLLAGLEIDGQPIRTSDRGRDLGVRLLDLDADGVCELVVGNPTQQAVFRWNDALGTWQRANYSLPAEVAIVDELGRDNGVRFVDTNDDLQLDVMHSNQRRSSLHLFVSSEEGWSTEVLRTTREDETALPMITRNGADNGAWFHSRHLWVQNEDTARLPDLVDRRSFNKLLADVSPMSRSPKASRGGLQARHGFRVELMAAEPMVRDPIAFDWGPDGRLWVVEMADYPTGNNDDEPPGGRIRVLADTDGDGHYDKSTLFLSGLPHPTSVMAWRDGVLVISAPDILFARDDDGDGKADTKEVLYTGFTEGNPQHLVNGLRRGLDNWIYGANGDSGGKPKSTKTGEEINVRGRDFRIRPDEGRIDAQLGMTQFGRCRDDWGNWFGCANPNPMWQYVLEDHYLRRNPHVAAPRGRVDVSVNPGASPVYPRSRLAERFNDFHTANRFTSACSVTIYRDTLFGPLYEGNMFVCEPVHNLVHRERVAAEGVTFQSRRAIDELKSEFLASTDNWFRPTTVRTGPDGALWVADMYRHVIEHPEWIPDEAEERFDLRAGSDQGRIWRVYPVGTAPRAIPRLDRLDIAALVQVLESPNGPLRDMAQQMLIERDDHLAVGVLRKMVADGARPTARLHALCTLDGLGALTANEVLGALDDSHPGVRRHAVRLSESLVESSQRLGEALLQRVNDPDPRVRLQLAYSLGQWHVPQAGRALARLAFTDAGDEFITAAVMSSAVPHVETMIETIVDPSATKAPPSSLIASLLGLATALDNEAAIVKLLPAVTQSEEAVFAQWQLTAVAGLLDLLDRRNSSLVQLRDESDASLRSAVERLKALFAFARAVAVDDQRPVAFRLQAMRLLGRGLEDKQAEVKTLGELLSPRSPHDIQHAAIGSLARMRDPAVPHLLLSRWKAHGPTARSEILAALFRRTNWLPALLDAVESGVIVPRDIGATHRQALLQHRSPEIRRRAEHLFAGAVDRDRNKIVTKYQAVVNRLTGHPTPGEIVFKKTCSVCHQLRNQGHAVGPDLSALTDKSTASLLVAIIDPNRAVEAKYLNYTALTRDGLAHTGLLAAETSNSVTLLGQEGKQQLILRTDLDLLESSGSSLMPVGVEKDINPQQMADVIAYVRSNAPKPKTFPGNTPAVVKAEKLRRELPCLPSNCEIYGESLRLEESNQNLGFWASEDDHAIWTIEVDRETTYIVLLEWACPENIAGGSYLLEVGDDRMTGIVKSTGDWINYRREVIGRVTLPAGHHRLGVRSNGKIDQFLFDLKSVTLRPVASQ